MTMTTDQIFVGDNRTIFVFGSNLAGRHGRGAARDALLSFGAIYGQGAGRQGNSYAIPTKGHNLEVLSLELISVYVEEFKRYAAMNKHLSFYITRVGCGLAGYTDKQMKPLFHNCPSNCQLPEGWL